MTKIEDSVCIYDIETQTFGKPDPTKDKLKIFGCYSYKTQKTYLLTNKEDIQRIINAHKVIVGFGNIHYDDPILKREGIKLDYKIIVDLKRLIENRAGGMKIKEGLLNDLLMKYSLDFITKTLGIVSKDSGKKEIDYSVFRKAVWTEAERKEIIEYTKRDIEVTKKLYEWVEDYFEVFKDFVNSEDIRKKKYLTDSIAKFSYKAICKAMRWEEEYGTTYSTEDSISGGYVAFPAGERFEGDIFCLDFNSLYPHIMIQCNLYGRRGPTVQDDRPFWTGESKWGVEGAYFSDTLSDVGRLLRKWYLTRMYYKRTFLLLKDKKVYKMKDIEKYKGEKILFVDVHSDNLNLVELEVNDKLINEYKTLAEEGVDRKEYTIKIILNTIYGILNNPYYAKVFDMVAGGDCTRVGRKWTKYARKLFRAAGYIIIYTDTDSVYIGDPFNDKERMLKVRDKIIEDIKEHVPFPQDTFDMGIDAEIKYMFFFKGGNKDKEDTEFDEDDFINKSKGLMKKNYIYVTKDDKVNIMNLGIKKKSNSPLSKKIFWEYMVPTIIKDGQVKFSKTYIRNLIIELLEKDLSLAALRKNVGTFKQYEKTSPNSIQAQIALKYGSGIHFLIPNNRLIGVGKDKKKRMCTMEEFKQHNMGFSDITLDNVWKELDYFIKPVVIKNIFDYVKKKDEATV